MTLSEVKRTLEYAGTLPGVSARVIAGANIRPGLGKKVCLTAVAVKYDEQEAAQQQLAADSRPGRRRKSRTRQDGIQPIQQMLPLTIASCGIFEGRTFTVIDGVNLDIPTFVHIFHTASSTYHNLHTRNVHNVQ